MEEQARQLEASMADAESMSHEYRQFTFICQQEAQERGKNDESLDQHQARERSRSPSKCLISSNEYFWNKQDISQCAHQTWLISWRAEVR
jgi:hypothetical protein